MKHYRICVYAICKNEEQFVDRWMDAVGEADLVVVLDTGSADGSAARLRARGAQVYEAIIDPWRFDTARNLAMDRIPEDFDICVSNDLDEVFEPGWRQRLEEAWQPQHTRARYLFVWSHRPDGLPEEQYPMEKIHRRQGFRWAHPVHEVLQYGGADPESVAWVDGLVLHHHPDPKKPRSQYLPLLMLSAQENPQDDRVIFWLGREYMYHGMHDQCIATLKRHLELPCARWDAERSASMRFIAKSYQAMGDMKQAQAWLYRAVAECPQIREPWHQMARLGYLAGDWPLAFLMTEKALAITENPGSYLTDPAAWGFDLYDLAAIACYRLGLYEKSYGYGQKAVEMAPDNPRLQKNLALIAEKRKG